MHWKGLLQDMLDMQQKVYTCLQPDTCYEVIYTFFGFFILQIIIIAYIHTTVHICIGGIWVGMSSYAVSKYYPPSWLSVLQLNYCFISKQNRSSFSNSCDWCISLETYVLSCLSALYVIWFKNKDWMTGSSESQIS